MYLDYILFSIGGILLFLALAFAFALLRSRKRSLAYRRVFREETERIDVITTLKEKKTSSSQDFSTHSSHALPATEKLSDLDKIVSTDGFVGKGSSEMQGATILHGKYRLLREIHGGNMSRVFLARHEELGNEWVVKFVADNHAGLIEEAEILEKLNHISLPQIIDIFHGELQGQEGMFLVESYIEGYSLSDAMDIRQQLSEGQICDWGIQMAQLLNYLHNLTPPIIHCDIKPANIMVTHDNRLVLVDFGISKRQSQVLESSYLTPAYAAPEQFIKWSNGQRVLQERFALSPSEYQDWEIDGRTDLYSVGVILYELIMGKRPDPKNTLDIQNRATKRLSDAIRKCLSVSPEGRFKTAKELIDALETVRNERGNIVHRVYMRRIASIFCVIASILGTVSTASAAYINRMENLSTLSIDPSYAIVTVQGSVQPSVSRTTPTGKVTALLPSQIEWSYSTDSIAQIDGDRLYGINIGKTTFYGKYRKNTVSMDVEVRKAVNNSSISLRYPKEASVSVYAGNGERDFIDGNVSSCSFVSPESLSMENGILYLSDSGRIRRVQDGEVSTIALEPDYLTVNLLRQWNENLYVLTGPWEDDNGENYYGFLKIGKEDVALIYMTDAAMSTISDFAFSEDGTLWFIQQNVGMGMTMLNTLDVNTMESEWIMNLPDGAQSMSFDGKGNLYISVPYSGIILRIEPGAKTPSYLAGIENERNFIDGAVPNFYQPSSLAVDGESLYVLDFDTVRRISIRQQGVPFTETLAGVPVTDTNPNVTLGEGWQTILPASELASITVGTHGEILLSDPKNSVIYQIARGDF